MEDINRDENIGIVKISDEVVSVIAGIAAQEVDGNIRLSKWCGRQLNKYI